MRVYIHLPDTLLPTLQDQARAACRPPRYHLEWLIRQALQERHTDEQTALLKGVAAEAASPYLLFAGQGYYPDGGWGDFRGAYASVEAARAAFNTGKDEGCWQWYDIVEARTWQCVATEGERYGEAPAVGREETP